MEHEAYLQSVGVATTHENYARCLQIMDSYGENHWWLSEPKTRAYYQTEELMRSGILLLPTLESYQRDLFALLARPVLSIALIEPGLSRLLQQAREAMYNHLLAQGHIEQAEALRQRLLQETINPMVERLSENVEKRGGIFFLSEETKKNLGRP